MNNHLLPPPPHIWPFFFHLLASSINAVSPSLSGNNSSDNSTADATHATMAANVSQGRYPKRNRAAVNYEIDQSVDGDLDFDDGNISEELGEGSPVSAGSNAPVALANAHQPDAATPVEDDSELEDATFGSRKTKKVWPPLSLFHPLHYTDCDQRKIMKKSKARAQPKAKRPPKFEPFRLM